MAKEWLKNKIRSNILVVVFLKKVRILFHIRLIQYNFFIKKISKIDSIKDYDLFKNKIQKRVGKTSLQDGEQYGEESIFYGHYTALCDYCGWKKRDFPMIPKIYHGINFTSGKWLYDFRYMVYACQGRDRINDIHEVNPLCLVFPLGPYIHYAQDYWSEQEFNIYKAKLGRVLLVFPGHSCEGAVTPHEDSFVDVVYNKYANNFSTILVCVYWNDVNDNIINSFKERGAVLVSAGFRGDFNFIRRLKTIIRLSDVVVIDNIGTNIGYCMYFNKPVYLEGNQVSGLDDKYYTYNFQRFKEAFFTKSFIFSEKQKRFQKVLYEEFWGGNNYIRTDEEMYDVLEALDELYKKSGYSMKRFQNILKDISENKIIEFQNNTLKKNKLLKESISV